MKTRLSRIALLSSCLLLSSQLLAEPEIGLEVAVDRHVRRLRVILRDQLLRGAALNAVLIAEAIC